MGKGRTTPAIKRAIIEDELIEEYHWLPQDIKKIPYKELQLIYIIRRQKRETMHQRQALQEQIVKSKERGSGSGQMKRMR